MKTRSAGPIALLVLAAAVAAPADGRQTQRATRGAGAGKGVALAFEPSPRAVPAPSGVSSIRDPKLAVGTSGAVYLLAAYRSGEALELGLSISHDGGDTFPPPVPVSPKGTSVSSHGENSPSLVVTPTVLYALWEQSAGEGTELLAGRSVSFGHHFEKPVRVTDKTVPSFNGFSSLGVAPDGSVYAIWLDGRDREETPDTFSLYVARSTDRGATFGKNVRVGGSACPCCRPSVAFGRNGEVFVAWRKVFDADVRDIVVSTSTDGGASFAAPARVAVDNWRLPGCPHSGPAVARNGSRLFVSWYTEGGVDRPGVRIAWSDDGGKTFARPVTASAGALDPNHPALSASDDGRLYLAFQGRDPAARGGWAPQRVFVSEISPAGAVSKPVAVPSDARSVSYPAIAAGTTGRVYVAWTEPGEGGLKAALSRGRVR